MISGSDDKLLYMLTPEETVSEIVMTKLDYLLDFYSVNFLLTIPATPFSVLTSEPLVQLSERFTAVALDAVLGHQLLERGSDLRERHLVLPGSGRLERLLEQRHVPADKVFQRIRRQLRLDSLLLPGIAEFPARGDQRLRRLALSVAEHHEPGLAYTLG